MGIGIKSKGGDMARLARKILEGNIFHIMTKGVNHEKIFSAKAYKDKIISYYFEKSYPWEIFAYAIMDNHTHFLIRVEDIPSLSEIMKNINQRYARYYNFISKRNGHVFQNRYKSVPTKDELNLFEVLRYIHNNPVFAGLENDPSSSKFTSFNSFFTGRKNQTLSTDFINYVEDNFKNIEAFRDFHKESYYKLELDIKEDEKKFKDYIINLIIAENPSKDTKLEYAKTLSKSGFSKRYLASKLGISRNVI